MNIEIKISKKPVEYRKAIAFLENRLIELKSGKSSELLWSLEHSNIYTGGISFKNNEIIDKKIKIIKTNRGGKITWHGPGQKVFYFVIDLSKRKKDIRKFIMNLERIIIESLTEYKIEAFCDRKNIGIWVNNQNQVKKIGAIGIKVKNWIAYHGFSLNINNKLSPYEKIVPCGFKDRNITNLKNIRNVNYNNLEKKIIKNFINYLKT